ncbi:MAG: sigma-70 family RNA polymerase sigma factor [Planctomycetes bacterium]|nr:sigma-70 family RNA polymerase sigma factor [Planctomycetota bacterium]
MHPNDPLNYCSDEELLGRLRNGQKEVFGLLVRRFQRELYGYLRRYLGDAHLADDVFQTTFLQVYTKIGQYEPERPAKPWIYTIATHQAIDALRKAGRQSMVSLEQVKSDNADGDSRGLIEMLESRESGPLDNAQIAERRTLVRASVDELPEFLRQVVVLAYYQGLKYREIADILEIPVGTVKSRLHAGLMKLQEKWSETPSPPKK